VRGLATVAFWCAIVLYSLVGLGGIVLGPTEFTAMFPIDFSSLPGEARATLFNQLRFFKALELSVGVGFFLFRSRLHVDAAFMRLVVFVLWITPVARVVSMATDGMPNVPFQLLTLLELTGAAAFTAHVVIQETAARMASRTHV
jgi:hypothetical protein